MFIQRKPFSVIILESASPPYGDGCAAKFPFGKQSLPFLMFDLLYSLGSNPNISLSLSLSLTTTLSRTPPRQNENRSTSKQYFVADKSITGDPSPFHKFNVNSTCSSTSFSLRLLKKLLFALLHIDSCLGLRYSRFILSHPHVSPSALFLRFREKPHSPRLAHKAPVMPVTLINIRYSGLLTFVQQSTFFAQKHPRHLLLADMLAE